jgi:hypothetical protein
MTIDERYAEYVKGYNKQYYTDNKEKLIGRAKKRYSDFTEEQKEARREYRRQYWLKNKK